MKNKTTFLVAIGITTLMASCGGNATEEKAVEFYQQAYDELKEANQSPILEDFFVISLTKNQFLDNIKTDKEKECAEVTNTGTSEKDAKERLDEIEKRYSQLAEKFDSCQNVRLEECIKRLAGKEIPCDYDSKVFSSLKVSVSENSTSWPLLKVTFTAPTGEARLCMTFLDKEGNVVETSPLYDSYKETLSGTCTKEFRFPEKGLAVRSVAVREMEAEKFVLERKKLGSLTVGMKKVAVPEAIPGLYDSFKQKTQTLADMDGEWTETFLEFYKNGKLVFKSWLENGRIVSIMLCEETGDAICNTLQLHPGSPLKDLISKEKKLKWTYYFDQYVYAESKDFFYAIPSEYLKDSGEMAIGQRPLRASDFNNGAHIAAITAR